jgi:transposase
MDWPISVAHHKLKTGSVGWWMRRHWYWPVHLPSVPTLTRRARAADFRWLLRRVLRRLRRLLGPAPTAHVVMDATLLLTGAYSRDPESRWTCHGGKWFRGYALHAICDNRGLLWAWHVTSANVQEMKVARRLIRQLASSAPGEVKMVIADSGYDSESLHQLVRRRLNARLLAPTNLRGAKTNAWRRRQSGRDAAYRLLRTKEGLAMLDERSVIERWNSWFKGNSNVSMLPYHVRRLHRVRLWINLKLAVFFGHQYLLRKDLVSVA